MNEQVPLKEQTRLEALRELFNERNNPARPLHREWRTAHTEELFRIAGALQHERSTVAQLASNLMANQSPAHEPSADLEKVLREHALETGVVNSILRHYRAPSPPSAGAQVLAQIAWSEFCKPGSLDDRAAAVAKLIQGFIDARSAPPPREERLRDPGAPQFVWRRYFVDDGRGNFGFEKSAPAEPPAPELPTPINHDLWRHLHDEHGLTLTQSELDEILRHAQPKRAVQGPCPHCGTKWVSAEISSRPTKEGEHG